MTEKGEAEGGVAADAIEADLCDIGNFADRIGAQVATREAAWASSVAVSHTIRTRRSRRRLAGW